MIQDLTIREVKQLNNMFKGEDNTCPYIGQYVVVRTCSAGVHTGFLKERIGKKVVLEKSRRIWSWEGAFTLSALSQNGITGGKIAMEVPSIMLQDIEIIPCSAKAQKIIQEYTAHE